MGGPEKGRFQKCVVLKWTAKKGELNGPNGRNGRSRIKLHDSKNPKWTLHIQNVGGPENECVVGNKISPFDVIYELKGFILNFL